MSQLPLHFEEVPDLQAAFLEFHRANPGVWGLFERFTLEAVRAGASKRIGARMVWERIRWETRVASSAREGAPRLNDHHVPYYARLFMERHPELGPVFETRALAQEKPR